MPRFFYLVYSYNMLNSMNVFSNLIRSVEAA